MEFRIADTFTDSLSRLTTQEQKAAKTTAFDLQLDASAPGLSFHKLDRAKDPNFWSVRVNADIRLIVQPNIASPALVQSLLTTAAATAKDHKFSPAFLAGEWAEVVDAWQI
jgi:plasmid maintenance system killer protein